MGVGGGGWVFFGGLVLIIRNRRKKNSNCLVYFLENQLNCLVYKLIILSIQFFYHNYKNFCDFISERVHASNNLLYFVSIKLVNSF